MRKKLNKTLGILFLFLTLICTNINILNFTLASLTKQDQILINANTVNEEKEIKPNLIALNSLHLNNAFLLQLYIFFQHKFNYFTKFFLFTYFLQSFSIWLSQAFSILSILFQRIQIHVITHKWNPRLFSQIQQNGKSSRINISKMIVLGIWNYLINHF